MKKIVLGIGGSSGAIYAKRFLDKVGSNPEVQIGVIASDNAITNWELEIGNFDLSAYTSIKLYGSKDFFAPFASGSARYEAMVVCPCSMGTLARIATGISNDLMTRSADVMLKERRRLVVVPRESPINLIHIQNMEKITLAGGIICPATPSFYNHPKTIDDVVDSVVDRILDLIDLPQSNSKRWGE